MYKGNMTTRIFYIRPLYHVTQKLKADMKSYITLGMAAIFFLANLFLKQGISSEYVNGWFHLHGQTRAARSENW